MQYAKDNKDTLVVVTADHETGGLLIEPKTLFGYTGDEIKISFNTSKGFWVFTRVFQSLFMLTDQVLRISRYFGQHRPL
ncbi:MAG: hypothetical protein Ct9H90mP4_03920 [Gammaproteobacteria bacterium]|nr:MAG: hypothetical protein Ct9H90mP4_03920 [Gammaproteobacteria bacterium]